MPSSQTPEDDRQPPWKRRAAAAEINGRRVNESIERGTIRPAPVFVCECGNIGCQATVTLPIPAYEAVRTDFNRFLVLPGHEIDSVDRVVETHPSYLVVVKREPEAREMAKQTAQRGE
jgi:hypothetical protein